MAEHSHSHGLIDRSVVRSREGLRAVGLSLLVLGLTAAAQAVVFGATDGVDLLADLIHNAGDAATAVPLGIVFALRAPSAERQAQSWVFVVLAIFVSRPAWQATRPCCAWPTHATVGGFAGSLWAVRIGTKAGRRLDSPALITDGAHATADAYVSLAVITSAAVVALGIGIADPVIGLAITVVMLRITRESWRTVRAAEHRPPLRAWRERCSHAWRPIRLNGRHARRSMGAAGFEPATPRV